MLTALPKRGLGTELVAIATKNSDRCLNTYSLPALWAKSSSCYLMFFLRKLLARFACPEESCSFCYQSS